MSPAAAPMAEAPAARRAAEARTRRSFVTPEGVDLGLRLADAGQRMAAFLIDLVIMLAILIGASLLVALAAFSLGRASIEAAAVIWLLGFFLLRNGYFILMEMGPRAATFGKRMSGIRVIARDGGRLTADAVIARNLMREIEFYLPLSFIAYRAAEGAGDAAMAGIGFLWTCLFLFFPFFNRDRLRIGDLLAGTWVIVAPKRKLGVDLLAARPDERIYVFTEAQLDAYGIFELQTLEQVLRDAKPEALASVAASIRGKIGAHWDDDDAPFLNAYYDALRLRLERKMLFGKRREDKFQIEV